jgi:archaemetzincin
MLTRRRWLAVSLGAVSFALARRAPGQSLPATSAMGTTVAVLPLGAFPPALLAAIDRGLRAELGVGTVLLPGEALPAAAYYPPRGRYRAERLLDALRARLAPPATRILGVTEADISSTAHGVYDWGVLGLGDLAGEACVISTFRCRRGARDAAQVEQRMVSTCVHEVGHTLGLLHCPDRACVMTDARGSVRTVDQTSGRMCNRCRARIGLAPR